MPYRITGGPIRFPAAVNTTPTTTPAPVEQPKAAVTGIDPNVLRNVAIRANVVKPGSSFDGVKRTGTDDDSLGGGAALKQKGIYDIANEGVVGAETDPDRLALRDAIWNRLETPSYLREPSTAKPVDAKKLAASLPKTRRRGRPQR